MTKLGSSPHGKIVLALFDTGIRPAYNALGNWLV